MQGSLAGGLGAEISASHQRAVNLQSGCDQGLGGRLQVSALPLCRQLHIAQGGRGTAVVLCGLAADVQLAFGVNRAAAVHATLCLCSEVCSTVERAAIGQPAVMREGERAATGLDRASVAHAQPSFRADQNNFACIHATQLTHIQGIGRRCAHSSNGGTLNGCVRAQCARFNLIGARNDLQAIGPNAGVDLKGSTEDGGVLGTAGIQARTVYADGATLHAVAFKTAATEDRRACGERDCAGIDESTASDGDAGGVRKHHISTLTGHLDKALQITGIAGVDFVENDASASCGQPRVTLHPATQLGLNLASAVVEDGTLPAYIKLAVGIAADSCCAGSLDVDLHHTVTGAQHRGLLPLGRKGVGNHAGHHGLRLGVQGRGHQPHHSRIDRECLAEQLAGQRHGFEGTARPRSTNGNALTLARRRWRLRLSGFSHRHHASAGPVKNDAVGLSVHSFGPCCVMACCFKC